ncbi:expressed unknown protein [Seminavis robusta]|uniref:Uncharacterized protein n=1 Tax=Seminavis robusta TaxID=568900 RepID=A0A9N8D7M8_9STRA|nr:expressed unknown protein [Seminavis robusta]|eukprot:Sro8_g006910.1 n/a (1044) ;mRNA; f:236319-239450
MKTYQRQRTHPASNTTPARYNGTSKRTKNASRHYDNTDYSYSSSTRRYRDSNLAMCLDVTRDLANEVYDFAQPTVVKGITSVQAIELKAPQCGPGRATSRGRSRNSSTSKKRYNQRPRRHGSKESVSSTSSYESTTLHDNPTFTSSWSDNRTNYDSSDTGMSERSRKPRRPLTRRGRSPTFRSKSVNASKRDKTPTVSMNPDNYIYMGKRKVTIAEPDLHSYLSLAENGGSAIAPTTNTPPAGKQTVTETNHDEKRRQPLRRGSFRQSSFGAEQETALGVEQSVSSFISIKSPTTETPQRGSRDNDGGEVDQSKPASQLGMAKIMMSTKSRMEAPPDAAIGEDALTVFSRIMTDCTSTMGLPPDGVVPLVQPPPPPPTTKRRSKSKTLEDHLSSAVVIPESPQQESNSSPRSTKSAQRRGSAKQKSPNEKRKASRSRKKEKREQEEGNPPVDLRQSPMQLPSLDDHRDQCNNVKIVVGKGSEQEVFSHNSHVLLYISDYFSQVMEPDATGDVTRYSSVTRQSPQQGWAIDFSHNLVSEWKMFYPFLEPPVKRTVSVDIHNMPILLPWFHKFKLPLLLNQCDKMLSCLYFRPPPLEQSAITRATISDLQDVLLLLYAALSCDLPQTQQLGIKVVETYLKESPFLFYYNSNGSVMQRLIILLQCFPHFQQQLWDSAIRSYLPTDLAATCDVESPAGRDQLLQNPLFPFLLREGLSKAKVKAKTRLYLRSKHQQQNQHQQEHQQGRRFSSTTNPDDYSVEANSILASGRSAFSFMNNSTASGTQGSFSAVNNSTGSGTATSGSQGGSCSSPSLLEGLSQASSMAGRSSYLNRDKSSNNGSPTEQLGTEEEDSPPLEMSIGLGELFWGPGWNEEPRLSLENHQRQRDRRRWLEDIVNQLKSHARQDAQLEIERSRRHSAAEAEAPTFGPSMGAQSSEDSLLDVQTEELRPPEVSSSNNVTTPDREGRTGVLARDATALNRSPTSVREEARAAVPGQPSYGKLVIQPASPSPDDRTVTTDPNSLSAGSAHTAGSSKLSHGTARRMFGR